MYRRWSEDWLPMLKLATTLKLRGNHHTFSALCAAADGEPRWIRTNDPQLKRLLLYQLS